MSNIIEKLSELILQSGKSISDISRKSNLSRPMIYKILKKEVSTVSTDTINKICNAIGVSSASLFPQSNISSADLGTAHVRIPVYGEIPAGIPIEMVDQSFIEDYEDINAEWVKDGSQYFCLRVRGESMMPKFENGDVLILKQQPDCNSGDYCAVSINCTECTFKKVIKHDNGITLQPLNPAFEPMFFSNKEIAELPITILGVVKEIRRGL